MELSDKLNEDGKRKKYGAISRAAASALDHIRGHNILEFEKAKEIFVSIVRPAISRYYNDLEKRKSEEYFCALFEGENQITETSLRHSFYKTCYVEKVFR